ncbi:WecB/TagA/CpsF family glycosyltransferase [Natranaerobius trueperi]|nr:WecB/TagA/CpsF family glycosyltransferase [Natranaerobius trueperi]
MNDNIKRAFLFDCPIDLVTYEKVLSCTDSWILNNDPKTRLIFAQNPEKVMTSLENKELNKALNQADILIPDGNGVVWALKKQGYKLEGRVTGIDLMHKLLKQAQQLSVGVYILGGKEHVVKKAVDKIKEDYPNITISGYHNGYFHDTEKIISDINSSKASILFTALGSPKQELFLTEHVNKLSVNVSMGIGGSLDVISGEVKRAPKWAQNLKLEWFYRIVTDPKRMKRGLKIPKFIVKVLFKSH